MNILPEIFDILGLIVLGYAIYKTKEKINKKEKMELDDIKIFLLILSAFIMSFIGIWK